ncbi:MAG: PASTA domain-containing protein, partial [Gemmatimonadota bacterium]|nr:PASTA domain-containing protein [Gemmatimonadota bacterium]
MNPRALARNSFPYLLVAVGGFLLGYVILFFVAFPADVLPDNGRVPKVVGVAFDDAAAAIGKAGFNAVKTETRYHRTIGKDVVLQQDPPAGSLQKRGIDINLAVSGGQRSATVPEVTGTSHQQARIVIENAGFQFGSVMSRTSELPRGAVISSDPPAGTSLQLPAVVSIAQSQGPATVQVPELVGRSMADARSALEQLGLRVGATSRDTSSFQPDNTVLGQAPPAGSTVSAGGAVGLRIS